MKMSAYVTDETTMDLVAKSIVGIDLAYEPALPAEDVIIFDLLANDGELVNSVTMEDARRLLGL